MRKKENLFKIRTAGTSIDNNGEKQRGKKAGRNLSTPCCVALGLHASAAEDNLEKKNRTGGARARTQKAYTRVDCIELMAVIATE